MKLAECLEGMSLPGRRSGKPWFVEAKVDIPKDSSSPNFSVGYRVRSHDGRSAFMKATDLSLLTEESGSLLERAMVAMQSHRFERDILDYCRGSNMDKVVVAIDYGDVMLKHDGGQDAVFYLMFELADHDLRKHADISERFTLSWSLGALHELSVAVQQLHNGNVAHNDIKPANVLVFGLDAQKLADLGCATSPLFAALHQERPCAGDDKYAAPEILYAATESEKKALCTFESRRIADLYNLGSVVFFLVTGAMLTPQVIMRLAKEHRPTCSDGGWNGNAEDVLPYWREAFGRSMDEFKETLRRLAPASASRACDELVATVFQLCEPEPRLRGHPTNRTGSQDRFGVERYVAMFDRLRKQVQVAA